jgi:hypothetical protein
MLQHRRAFTMKFSSSLLHPISHPIPYHTFKTQTRRWFGKTAITFWYELKIKQKKFKLGRKNFYIIFPTTGRAQKIYIAQIRLLSVSVRICVLLEYSCWIFVNFFKPHLPANWAQTWCASYFSDTKKESKSQKFGFLLVPQPHGELHWRVFLLVLRWFLHCLCFNFLLQLLFVSSYSTLNTSSSINEFLLWTLCSTWFYYHEVVFA